MHPSVVLGGGAFLFFFLRGPDTYERPSSPKLLDIGSRSVKGISQAQATWPVTSAQWEPSVWSSPSSSKPIASFSCYYPCADTQYDLHTSRPNFGCGSVYTVNTATWPRAGTDKQTFSRLKKSHTPGPLEDESALTARIRSHSCRICRYS
jgi:hypothetical protein